MQQAINTMNGETFSAIRAPLTVNIEAILDLMSRAESALVSNPAGALDDIQGAYALAVGLPQNGIAAGGLAPWQIRKVIRHIEENLTNSVPVSELAALANLCESHFAKAFRKSFQETPHNYLIKRRLSYAQGLMATLDMPLSQVALECGMSDQSHFTHLFRKFIGVTPNVWRRRSRANIVLN